MFVAGGATTGHGLILRAIGVLVLRGRIIRGEHMYRFSHASFPRVRRVSGPDRPAGHPGGPAVRRRTKDGDDSRRRSHDTCARRTSRERSTAARTRETHVYRARSSVRRLDWEWQVLLPPPLLFEQRRASKGSDSGTTRSLFLRPVEREERSTIAQKPD
ncbi:hypothetical protein MRX96_027784 [Rhipicephalus microplus]